MRLKIKNFTIVVMSFVILLLFCTNIYTKHLLVRTTEEYEVVRTMSTKDDEKLIIGAYKYGPKEIE